ncbi:MAG TPA: hypothetical protein VE871_19815 [Longimicrobium sp.]|nr:hypothetical protein [Longimicrobium sp.]
MKVETFASLAAVAVALVGFIVTYAISLRLAVRKDQLDRVDRQLRDLYGPLFSLNRVSAEVYRAFRQEWRRDVQGYWSNAVPPTDDEARAWRLCMVEVFFPLIARMEDLVIQHADLIDETEMPGCLLELVTHVSTYRAVLRAWEEGDYSRHTSMLPYPRQTITEYLERRYAELKHRQGELLGTAPSRRAGPSAPAGETRLVPPSLVAPRAHRPAGAE